MVNCPKCGEDKPRDAFYDWPHSTRPRLPCKACILAAKRARYAAQGGDRASHAQVLREKYGLTPADYDRMLAAQEGVCAVCREPERVSGRNGTPRRLAVDHDHRTGAVRGLLCARCNQVAWAVEENHHLLDAMRVYLESHCAPPPRS